MTSTCVADVALFPALATSVSDTRETRMRGEIVKYTRPVLASSLGTPTMMSRAPSPVTSYTCAAAIVPAAGLPKMCRFTCPATAMSTVFCGPAPVPSAERTRP